jgi:polar amino acid transport system substrate-binding protein
MRRDTIGLAAAALLLAACSSGTTIEHTATTASADPVHDKLAQVLDRGTLVLFTDPAYPPQSEEVKGAARPAGTKCLANQLTGPQMTGYDAETGKAVAKALGVEPCFVTPSWTEVTSGNWGDRWDVAWGSGAINADRMSRLYVTLPSYTTPAVVFVATSSPIKHLSELSGHPVGACAGCTMQQYLEGTLQLPGVVTKPAFTPSKIVTYDTEVPGLKAVGAGKLDAFLCSEPVGAGEIAAGVPLRQLPEPAYQTFKTGYVDRSSGLSATAFVARLDKILAQLHADGTMARLSQQAFGKDYATDAATFDIAALGQKVS